MPTLRLCGPLDISNVGAMARVVLNNVTKDFPGERGQRVRAVDGLTLEIGPREFVVLAGPSGCGKTTALRLIAGLETPDAGSVSVDGAPLAPKDRDIAMVFQSHALFPHLTAYQNMAFGLRLRKFAKAEIDRRVREASELLGLTALLDRKPQALSGGECQRVALGRAMVRRPKVFLFDEPLSNLDGPMRAQLRGEIQKLHCQLDASMVYVTHDMAEAAALADRIGIMRAGQIEQIGAPSELGNNPANTFVAQFLRP